MRTRPRLFPAIGASFNGGLRITVAVVAATAMLAGGCNAPRAELDPADLRQAARAVSSLAAESALMAKLFAEGHVNENFVWTHQRALQEHALQIRRDLHRHVPPALQARVEQVAAVDGLVESALARIGPSRDDQEQLIALVSTFGELGRRAQSLEEPQ